MDCMLTTEQGSKRDSEFLLTKYSDVLPEASFIPPPKTVEEVVWTWGVADLAE
jgi:hypothetical protein